MVDHRLVGAAEPVAKSPLTSDVGELHREIYVLRDEVLALQARLGQTEVLIKKYRDSEALDLVVDPSIHVENLQSRVADLEFQLQSIKASTSWKLGRLLLSPIRLFRR